MNALKRYAPVLFVVGLILFFAGERISAEDGGMRWILTIVGGLLVLDAAVVRILEWTKAKGAARTAVAPAALG